MHVKNKKKNSVLNLLYIAFTKLLNLLVRTSGIYLYVFFVSLVIRMLLLCQVQGNTQYGLQRENSSVRSVNERPFAWF
jgi:hypothetical protein